MNSHAGGPAEVPPAATDAPCELRVHGVGGDSPQTVLGMPYPEDATPAWSTEGGRRAVLHRRNDDRVRVFSWGELTSGSRWFALWTLLLPFTLANVAGWAHPAASGRWAVRATRAVALLFGLLLSVSVALWLAIAGVSRLPVAAGIAVAAAAMAAIVAIATWVARPFERYRLPSWTGGPPKRTGLDPAPGLDDPQFFDNGAVHRRRWWHHLAALLVVGAVVVIVTSMDADRDAVLRNLGWMSLSVTAAQLVLVVVLGALSFRRVAGCGEWRWSAPAMCSGAAVLVTGGVVSALLAAAAGGPSDLASGPAFLLLDVYAAAAAVALITLLCVAGVVLLRAAPAEKTDKEVPAHEQLLPSAKARRAARIAQVVRHIDLPATALVATFALGGLCVVVFRCLAASPGTWQPGGNMLTRLSLGFLGLFSGFLVRDIGRNAFNLNARRRVGQIWDILTFWPRHFHPFAVRPYAERAVPELQEYLRTGGSTALPRRWVITAHSQGSVLAYAALRSSPVAAAATGGSSLPPVDLVTFGTPCLSLYAKAYPQYFRPDDFADLERTLTVAGGSWVNLFRATDAVGRELFTGRWPDLHRADMSLEDPNRREPRPDANAPDGEHDLPVDGQVWGHSGYRRCGPFKDLVYERLGRSRERGLPRS